MKIIDEVSNIREHLDNLLELPDRMIVQSVWRNGQIAVTAINIESGSSS